MRLQGHTILCFRMEDEQGRKAKAAALMMGIRIQTVGEEQYSKTIGEILGNSAAAAADSAPESAAIEEKMMILCGFNERSLDQFLNKLRSQKVNIELKAVATPYNMGWTPEQLYGELLKERDAYKNKEK